MDLYFQLFLAQLKHSVRALIILITLPSMLLPVLALKKKETIRMRNQDSLKSYFTNESQSFNTKKIKEY